MNIAHAYPIYRIIEQEVYNRMNDLGVVARNTFFEASREMNIAFTAYGTQEFDAAQSHFERALELLDGCSGSEIVQALSRSWLVSIYGRKGLHSKALASGMAALDPLRRETRLPLFYASCLHDTGLSLFNVGRPSEGIQYLEQALAIYQTSEEGAEAGATCMKNLAALKAHLAEHPQPSTPSQRPWWSRVFRR